MIGSLRGNKEVYVLLLLDFATLREHRRIELGRLDGTPIMFPQSRKAAKKKIPNDGAPMILLFRVFGVQ